MRENPRARQLIAGAAGLAVAVTGLVALAPTASANPAGTDLVISEAYGGGGNSGATFKNDFIELYNPTTGAIDLTGYKVEYLAANGNSGGSTTLSGSIPAGKHWLIQQSAGAGGSTDLPTPDATGSIQMAGSNFSVRLTKNGAAVDLAGFGTATQFEGQVGAPPSNTTSASRTAVGKDTDVNATDFTVGAPTPTASGGSGPVDPVDPVDPVEETLSIAEIQGTGATSPKVGVIATTTGVVTAKFPTGGFSGFYLQTGGPDTTPDASDGLFVYAPGNDQSTFQIGDTVTVKGKVSEFGELTQVAADTITVAAAAQAPVVAKTQVPGTDCDLPGDACADAAALNAAREKVEGELLKPSGDFTVTDVYDGSAYVAGGSNSSANFGEIGLAAESRTPLYTVTDVVDPRAAAAVAARTAYNNAHRVILDDGSSTNFSTSTGSPLPWFTPDHQPRVGAGVTFPGGAVLDYRFGWKLQPPTTVKGAPSAQQPQFAQTRKATPDPIAGALKLATFNVLNYFPTLGESWTPACTAHKDRTGRPVTVNQCPGTGPRGAWDQANFERQQAKIVKAINAMNADVVSLEEIENRRTVNGGDRDAAVATLVAALNADAGSTRWAFAVSPTAVPAVAEEDVIRTGFIYNPATVETVGEAKMLIGSAAFANAREPFAQAFKPKGAPASQTFAAIVNHFKSKGSGVDDGTGQGKANPDRVAQAKDLATFAKAFATERGTDKVFLTGDFNAYSKEDPVVELEKAGFANLESTANPAERSYSFDGASGSLDHVFASPAAEAWVKGVDIWEINANEVVYNQYSRHNYNVTDLYQANVFSASDHNPEIVGFTPTSTTEPTGPVDVQILGTNDFHGRLLPNGDESGAAQFAGAVAQLRAENPNTVFAAGGDLIGASTFESFIQRDKPTLDALNAAGLDVSAAGNHEFDAGLADLTQRVMKPYDATSNPEGGATWQYLAANVRKKSDNSYALPDVAASPGESDGATWIKEIDGVKVGFVGTVTEDLPSLVTPGGIEDVKVTSIIEETNAAADALTAAGADLVVMLVHEGATGTSKASAEDTTTAFGKIVAGVDNDVDAIISGHTHLAYNHSIGGRPVVSSGQYGTNLNKLVFSVDPATDKVTLKSQEIVKAKDVALTAPAATAVKTEVSDIVAAAQKKADELGAQELGKLGGPLNRAKVTTPTGTSENRGGESTLGNVVAEAQRKSAGADIGLMNPGGLRADMLGNPGGYPATLTYKQAAAVQPFANTLVNMKYTGAQIKTVLEQQWQRDAEGKVPSRAFLRLGTSAGFTFTYDVTRPEGDRITGMWLNSVALDTTKKYTVTVNSFLATGGDNFRELVNGTDKVDTGKSDLGAMVDYMAQFKTTPLAVDWSQHAVGLSTPAEQPSSYRPGESGTVTLSSLAFTGTGDVHDTKVIAQTIGGARVLGTATVDNTVGTVANDENGTATLTFVIPTGTPAGEFTFEVVGDTTDTRIPVTVNVEAAVKADATVSATASPTSVEAQTGTSTLTVDVTSTGSTPTGLVTAQVGDQLVGGGELVDGKATFTVGPFTTVGVQSLVVKYLGDGSTKPAQGSVQVNVTKAATPVKATPVLKATIAPASVVVKTGRAIATVDVTSPDGKATGTVAAKVGNRVAGLGTIVDGRAVVDLLPFAKVGTTAVTFSYLGDDDTLPGSTTASVKVTKATAAIILKAPKKAKVKKKVNVTVTVAAPGQTPRGKVTIRIGGKAHKARVKAGKASITVRIKKKGTFKVTAHYSGDAFVKAGSATPTKIKVTR